MDPQKWERVKEVYHSAVDRDPGVRAAFLDQACRDDHEVRKEVESLLAQASGASFLDRPAWEEAEPAGDESAPRRKHPFFWVVLLMLALVGALFGYTAWVMPRDAVTTGWAAVRYQGVTRIARVDPAGPAAGKLQTGDRLLSFNGDGNAAHVGPQFYRQALAPGDRYRVQVSRAGEVIEYSLTAVGRSPDLTFRLGYFLIGLSWCVVGFFVGFARPQDPLARLAFLAAVSAGVVFASVGNLSFYALQPLHMILGYHFFYRFPGGAPRGRGWRVLLWLLYLSVAVVVLGNAPGWLALGGDAKAATAWWAWKPRLWFSGIGPVSGGVAILGAVALAVQRYRTLQDPNERRRFHWVAVGGVVGLAPVVAWSLASILRSYADFASWLLPGRAWVKFSMVVNTCSVAVPVSVAYAVLKHRVFDVQVAIRRGLQYLFARRALQALLALPSGGLLYTLVSQRNRTIAEIVTESGGYLIWIAALVLSLKVRGPLLRWLDRRFFRAQYDSEQIVLSLVDELTGLDSAEEVSGFLCRQLERSLHPKSLQLWWREGGVMRLAGNSGISPRHPPCPTLSDALLNHLRQQETVVSVPLPASTGVSPEESRRLLRMGIRLIVPVTAAGELEGVLVLGEKQSEEPYTDADTRLVHAVARQTAVVLDNLRLKGLVHDEQRIRRDVLAKFDRGLVHLMRECPVCGACYDSGAETCARDGQQLTLTLPVARTIDGKYRLDRLIGRGGMGAVYEACDLRLGRDVAVKVMLAEAFGHEGSLRRFRREAQAVARLNHPNVVVLHDFGELEGGGAYLVMERVAGVTLRAEMKRVGVFAPAATAEWFEPMLDGLAAAHQHGVVHRDFKPENVIGARLASGALAVKILDFGLAKVRPLPTAAVASHSLTQSGVVMGTLAYMAPEQVAGKEVDHRADIFAAGVVLAEMLTGRRPLEDSHLPPAFPSQSALESVLRRCLAVAPGERFSSVAELRATLIPALRAC